MVRRGCVALLYNSLKSYDTSIGFSWYRPLRRNPFNNITYGDCKRVVSGETSAPYWETLVLPC
jgi:hypothetical protein